MHVHGWAAGADLAAVVVRNGGEAGEVHVLAVEGKHVQSGLHPAALASKALVEAVLRLPQRGLPVRVVQRVVLPLPHLAGWGAGPAAVGGWVEQAVQAGISKRWSRHSTSSVL